MNNHGPNWEILAELDEPTARRIRFILELDKLKQVIRRTPLLDGSRTETVAEHCWQVALMAVILSGNASPEVRIDRVVRMLLIHDLVEIDAGDTFLYDDAASESKDTREQLAAERIFGLLPDDLGQELRALWEEFEQRQTADALFAAGLDRLQPLLHNYFTGGGTWKAQGVTRDKVEARKRVIGDASAPLWAFAQSMIADGVQRGFLRSGEDEPGQAAAAAAGSPSQQLAGAVTLIAMTDVPPAMRLVSDQYQAKHGTVFRTLTHVPAAVLHHLHAEAGEIPPAQAVIASTSDNVVREAMAVLGDIANMAAPSMDDRRSYFAALQTIYRRLPQRPQELAERSDVLCIGPQREGRILADVLDCLPAGRHLTPSAKRMPYQEGLLVGLDIEDIASTYRSCMIIDGAIASGVTLMAIMHRLRPAIQRFHIFSAHATSSSLRALARFCAWIGVEAQIVVGHVSGSLNRKYYAVDQDGRLAVGDLGDMISPVADS